MVLISPFKTAISFSLSAFGLTLPSPATPHTILLASPQSRGRYRFGGTRQTHPYLQQPICADARAFLQELLRQKDSIRLRNHESWDARCARLEDALSCGDRRTPQTPTARSASFILAEVIGTESDPNDLLVSGSSGSGIEIFLLACPTRNGQRIYHTAGLGSMGYGLPMSLAVCIGGGRRRTILVDGDGGFQFNIQELETVSRLSSP